jgi:hypothetical protein
MGRKTMSTWLDEAMRDSDKDGQISQMTLVHMVGQQQREIHSTKFSAGKSWTAKDLSDMFRSKAEVFCQDLSGVHTFNLIAFYGGRNSPEAFYPFVVNSTADPSGMLATEQPTHEGRTMQSMRQSEMVFQQTYRRQQQQDEYTLRLLEIQNRMLSETMGENRDMFNVMKEMMMTSVQNQHKLRMEELEYDRSSAERRKMLGFIPPLVNTMLGREVFPQSTEDTALVEAVAESLDETAVIKLAEHLPPTIVGPLMARVEKVLIKKRGEHAAEQKTAAIVRRVGVRNPEADAAGDPVQ